MKIKTYTIIIKIIKLKGFALIEMKFWKMKKQ